MERQSLSALDAFADAPAGTSGFEAAGAAELLPVGPLPDGDDEERLMPLVERFNTARAGKTDPATIAPLLGPIMAHYRPLFQRACDLLWRCGDLSPFDVLLVDEANQADSAKHFAVEGLAPVHLLVGDAGQITPFATVADPGR